MALLDYLMEGTPGANVTTATIVSEPAGFQALTVAPGAGNDPHTFQSGQRQSGETSIRMITAAGTPGVVRLPFAAASSQVAVTFYHYTDATLLSALVIAIIRHTGGGLFRIVVSTTGAVMLQDSAGVTLISTAAGAWVSGQWNRIAFVATIDTASTGSMTLNVYQGNGLTPSGTFTTTTANLGTEQAVSIDIGSPASVLSGQTGGLTHFFDTVRLDDGAATEIGPYFAGGPVSVLDGPGTGDAGWQIFGTAANEGVALNDDSLDTGVESPEISSTASVRRYRLASMSPRTELAIILSGVVLTEGAASPRVRVYSGASTLITDRALPATTTVADRTIVLTPAEVAAITDWTYVSVELVAVA